ncbi:MULTISPECIES: DUF4229 domain-containing protein [Arsenicicoccus]|uniref:DUF4229 domain-containing protein n=1 Tax=Arsenicicoccus TaxID=267408 RepID=UPI00257D2E8D|nr:MULTISPECIES: DUF4229 domain-containing protein [Arsenicicoccus]
MSSPGLRYSLLRIMLFLGCLIVLWLVGLRGLLLVILAGLLSMVASLFVLRGPREEFSARIAERVDRKAARAEAAGAHKVSDEEVEDDEIRRTSSDGRIDDRAARRTDRRHDGL